MRLPLILISLALSLPQPTLRSSAATQDGARAPTLASGEISVSAEATPDRSADTDESFHHSTTRHAGVRPQPNEGGFTIHHSTPLDRSAPDLGAAAQEARLTQPANSPERSFAKGLIYQRAAIDLYNQGHYKRAYALFQTAEAALIQTTQRLKSEI